MTELAMEAKRDDLRTTRWSEAPDAELEEGRARLRIDHFALTANNVTYAVFGDAMSYWQFFPAAEGWGRVPVWGFADVEASRVDGLDEGDRVYGYLPMATEVVVVPARVGPGSFVDAATHRAALPPVYNQYLRVAGDPEHDPNREREYALLRPLFVTSFLIDDWLADNEMFDARSIVIASASSKTALALAQLLSVRSAAAEVVGLTSPANAEFVRSVGYYDRTVEYGDIGALDADTPSIFVDMAGGGRVMAAVHRHFAGSLRQSCLVGATHWEETTPPVDLPGPRPTFFFAPDRLVKRRADWGPGGVEERVATSWHTFLDSVDGWLTVVERHGRDDLESTWLEVLDGRASPDTGYVLSLTRS
jgi:NADPH:quinone reductase-like Zn-dependent oxidoreductase